MNKSKRTVAELEKIVADLEQANSKFVEENMQLSINLREAVNDGDRWREQFWFVLKLTQSYVERVPKSSPVAQARMTASVDPKDKKWNIFWEPNNEA